VVQGNLERSAGEDFYWRVLSSQDPKSVCRRTLATFDQKKQTYELRVADLTYAVAPGLKTVTDMSTGSIKVDWDVRLLTLVYMTGATETPLTGRWVSPTQFSGGDLFFSSEAHNLTFARLLVTFASPEAFLKAGEKIKAVKHMIGDASFVLQTLPRIPILFTYWSGDEQLLSKISVFFDESASSHLAVDGLWLAINVSEKRLLQVKLG